MALSPMAHMPADTDALQTGHSGPMAPQGFVALLGMEISTAEKGTDLFGGKGDRFIVTVR